MASSLNAVCRRLAPLCVKQFASNSIFIKIDGIVCVGMFPSGMNNCQACGKPDASNFAGRSSGQRVWACSSGCARKAVYGTQARVGAPHDDAQCAISKAGIPTPHDLRMHEFVGWDQPYFDKTVQSFKKSFGIAPPMRFDGIGPDRMGHVFRFWFEFPEHESERESNWDSRVESRWGAKVVAYLREEFPSYAFSIEGRVISAWCNADKDVSDKDFARDLQKKLDATFVDRAAQ